MKDDRLSSKPHLADFIFERSADSHHLSHMQMIERFVVQ